MAHTCPDCYSICHCGGDIDDCLIDNEDDVIRCTHWKTCERDDSDDYEYDEVER